MRQNPFYLNLWYLMVLLIFTNPHTTIAQVTYFDKPPTTEELKNILNSTRNQKGILSEPGRKVRGIEGIGSTNSTRGIEWNKSTDSAPRESQQPQTPPVAAFGANNETAPNSSVTSGPRGPAVAVPINFNLGSSDIKGASMPYVDAIASLLLQDPAIQLTVEGHTDSSGDPGRNLMLSWERAFTVFRVLVTRYGIDPARLKPVGKGASEPIEGTGPNQDINRRVQFRILG